MREEVYVVLNIKKSKYNRVVSVILMALAIGLGVFAVVRGGTGTGLTIAPAVILFLGFLGFFIASSRRSTSPSQPARPAPSEGGTL